MAELGSGAAGEDELPGSPVAVVGPLHGRQHGRHLPPFVEQERAACTAERRIGVGAVQGGDAGLVEAGDLGGVPGSGRRLAGRARSGDHDSGELGEQLGEVDVRRAGPIGPDRDHLGFGPGIHSTTNITQLVVPRSCRPDYQFHPADFVPE